MKKYTAGIIGGGGYTAGELIRILSGHPMVDLEFVFSNSQSGNKISSIHEDLLFLGDRTFAGEIKDVDVLFLCQGHGKAKAFLEHHKINEETIIIDLGNDFRIGNKGWVYGLPELYKGKITQSKRIANPGCFATAIQLALLPLANKNLLTKDIHVSAVTGSTGAGQSLQRTTHFSWRQNNISVYKAFAHQHEAEIYQSINHLSNASTGKLRFLPYRGDFTRGIYGSIYTEIDLSETELIELYKDFYKDAPFTFVTEETISLKSVVNTNYCYLQIAKHDDQILIHTAIDNLIKGASGQAVQNMNLCLGLEENTGLYLKPSAY
jgi:N-acetyl-gamma-glutamyl-phosphate reductase